MARFCPQTGQVPHAICVENVTGLVFARFLDEMLTQVVWKILVMDKLSIHGTPDVKAALAKHGKVEVVRPPTSEPWLNLIEPWFSTITRRALRDILQSREEVSLVLSEFAADWRSAPKPYLWGRNGNGRRQLSASIS